MPDCHCPTCSRDRQTKTVDAAPHELQEQELLSVHSLSGRTCKMIFSLRSINSHLSALSSSNSRAYGKVKNDRISGLQVYMPEPKQSEPPGSNSLFRAPSLALA